MKEQEAFAALVKRDPGYLARPIEELVKMSAVGSVYLSTHQALLRKIKSGQLGLAEEDRKTKLAEGQIIGEALLGVERRIGELSFEEPKVSSGRYSSPVRDGAVKPKHGRLGMTRGRMEVSQAIARHPEAVARVVAEAKRNEDIPTKTAVLQRIRLDHLEKNAGKIKEKNTKDISEVALMLIRELGDVVAKLPALWKEREYLPKPLQESIVDAIEKLSAIVEVES